MHHINMDCDNTLYNKYAPKSLNEVLGQNTPITIINNMLNSGKIPNGIILYGPSGTGKTTLARLIVKNLLHYDNNNMSSMRDYLEIDGAYNNGVEFIRNNILEELQYMPYNGKYKIIIIDEAHNLSRSAFDVLLNVLQEHQYNYQVVFIFTTTNHNKIPETIQSRCISIGLQKINNKTLNTCLQNILSKENLEISSQNQQFLIQEAGGNLRQMLSMLQTAQYIQGDWFDHFKIFTEDKLLIILQDILDGQPEKAKLKWLQYEQVGYNPKRFFYAFSKLIDNMLSNINKYKEIKDKYILSDDLLIKFWTIILQCHRAHVENIPRAIPIAIELLCRAEDQSNLLEYAKQKL